MFLYNMVREFRSFFSDETVLTMVMSSSILPSHAGKGTQNQDKGEFKDNEDMQWIFLTTAKCRDSIEEQTVVIEDGKNKNISDELNKNGANRTDSPKHNATCLKTSDELKLKYSDKWIKHVRHMNGTRFEKRNESVRKSFKRHKFDSFRFQSRKLSMKESSLPLSSLEKDRPEGILRYLV